MDRQLRVGLVGAGPWAKTVHAPGLAGHPGTAFTAVWTRRPEPGKELAEAFGASAAGTYEELLDQVDAVTFAVPPASQAELALQAVRAGKHVVLEKPIANDLATAERLTDAVAEAGVAALVMFTMRYAIETREWLDELAATGGWTGGGMRWLSGALLAGQYRDSRWRHEEGSLADIGPHVVDLLDAALGPIVDVVGAHTANDDLWHLILAHESGATSTASLSARTPVQPTIAEVAVYGTHGHRAFARPPGVGVDRFTVLLDDFVAMVATGTTTHPCDVRRGLHVQRVLARAREVAGR